MALQRISRIIYNNVGRHGVKTLAYAPQEADLKVSFFTSSSELVIVHVLVIN